MSKTTDYVIDTINHIDKATFTVYLIVEKDSDNALPEAVHCRVVGRHENMTDAVDECNQMIDDYIL